MKRGYLNYLPVAAGLLILGAPVHAEDVHLRTVDVGNGLCVVIHVPGGHSMLFDAGDKGTYCRSAVAELIPEDRIDLIVLSHSDADHIGELPEILQGKHAGTIVYPGDHHLEDTQAIRDEVTAINSAGGIGTRVWNLAATPLPDPDAQGRRVFMLGEARVTLVAGWSNGDMTIGTGEAPLPKPEHNNALSIVARVEYRGHAVLLTGDTVGRFRGNPGTACAYAERIMTGNAATWPIASDVLIGQHHGGDNASSNCFIRAVKPRFVVFSAGHKGFHHPTQAAADRFIANGVNPDNMLRTDRGDDEGKGEWQYGDIRGCEDQPGDDDVDIWLPGDASAVRASYRLPAVTCPVRNATFFAVKPRARSIRAGKVSPAVRRKSGN